MPTFDLLLELLDRPKQRGAGRTNVAASRDLTLLLQMAAELALRDLAERIIEIELRHAERAAIDAVAAADAAIGIVRDDAGHFILLHGADRADRHAGRIDAMQAVPFDEGKAVDLVVLLLRGAVAIDLDDVERAAGQVFRRIPGILIPVGQVLRDVGRHIVGGFARRHTRLAADA